MVVTVGCTMTSNSVTVGDLLKYIGHDIVEQPEFMKIRIAVPVRMRMEEEGKMIVIKLENGKSLRIHCIKL